MRGLFLRLLGFRMIESPEAVRITAPKWIVKVFPNVMEEFAEKTRRDSKFVDVRVVGRSTIARLR